MGKNLTILGQAGPKYGCILAKCSIDPASCMRLPE